MKSGSFIIDGVTSESLNSVIQSRPLLETPLRRVSLRQTYGQNGSTAYDENAYENTQLSLILYASGPDAVASREAIFKAFDGGSYKDLIMYCDPTKIYQVLATAPPKFESRYYFGENLSYNIDFTVRPYKKLVLSPMATITVIGTTITNPTLYDSLPTITIFGSGDISLSINGTPYLVKGVDTSITIDSEPMFGYKESGGIIYSANNKIYFRDFPKLKPGVNTISWTGTVTKIEIKPNWRTLV